ncbi:MAG: DNA polymerase III subunit delta [Planctomycetia bacterium]|nr:DNA polymerase III subunit delta [Planctomycetia bacterium]
MAKSITAFQFLNQRGQAPVKPVIVLFGDDLFLVQESLKILKSQLLPEEDSEFSFTRFDGNIKISETDEKNKNREIWVAVRQELATMSMFGGDRRLVLVDQADNFISAFRPDLENYVQKPSSSGILILQPKSFAANTRLFKLVDANGLMIDCRTAAAEQILSWMIGWAQQKHHINLVQPAAEMLLEKVGEDLGMLDQQLARLALIIPENAILSPDIISKNVGNWRTQKVWDMLDYALNGKTADALRFLNQLFASKEDPVGVLAQITTTLRKLAAATRIYLNSEKQGRPLRIPIVLERAGFSSWLAPRTEPQMKMLGRSRGARLYQLLNKADRDLKGESSASCNFILERFIVEISHPGLKRR